MQSTSQAYQMVTKYRFTGIQLFADYCGRRWVDDLQLPLNRHTTDLLAHAGPFWKVYSLW